MQFMYSEEKMVELTSGFFNETTKIFMTFGGSAAMVFSKNGGGTHPWLGAYHTGENWLPCSWTDEGKIIPEVSRKMDLMIAAELVSA
jgi:hypothetical protein